MEMINIPAGLLGYRGVWGAAWTQPPYPTARDWNGGYVSTHAEDALGYIVPPPNVQAGSGLLFEVTITVPHPAVMVPQGAEPDPAAIRAFVARAGYRLDPGASLIDALSAVGLVYVGPSAPPAYEAVLARPLLDAATRYVQVATLTWTKGRPDYADIRLATGRHVTRAQIDGVLLPATFVP